METSATARLLADVLADEWAEVPPPGSGDPSRVVTIDDGHGLTAELIDRLPASTFRVHSDRLEVELDLRARCGDRGEVDLWPRLDPELFTGADVVALDLPASRSALDQVARLAAAQGARLLLGVGRDRHMNQSMNSVLARSFGDVHASRGRQKARVLVASAPLPSVDSSDEPRHGQLDHLDLAVRAFGGAFAGPRLDGGTRLLLGTAEHWRAAEHIVDLGCGTGVLAVIAARRNHGARVRAIDESAAACRSAEATAAANGLADRIEVRRADGLSSEPEHSAELIVCNPPFHVGTAKDSTPAIRMLGDAARVLVPGGELWTVHNSHLPYRKALRALVGPTELVSQDRAYQVLRTRRWGRDRG